MPDDDDVELTVLHSRQTAEELLDQGIQVLSEPASPEECEKADFVVCAPVWMGSAFIDNKVGACSKCNTPIFYRPHAPTKPPKVCMRCAGLMIAKEMGHT